MPACASMTDQESSRSVIPTKAGIQFVVNAFAIRSKCGRRGGCIRKDNRTLQPKSPRRGAEVVLLGLSGETVYEACSKNREKEQV
jgi:hypothetical protein